MEYIKDRFTEEELLLCRQTDLVLVCEHLGYQLKKEGSVYTRPAMDSIKIFHRRTYTRFSDHTGGSCIDFLINVEGMDWRDAVEWLLDFNNQPHIHYATQAANVSKPKAVRWFDAAHAPGKGYLLTDLHTRTLAPVEPDQKAEFILPEANKNNDSVRRYLIDERYLSPEVVDFFICCGMIYESAGNHNVVFVGRDKDGNARHASLRGTYTEPGRKAFKGSVTGSDTGYTFNLIEPDSDHLVVCEAPIDCMSYLELAGGLSSEAGRCNYLALSGTHDRSLERFLSENDHIHRIILALDADEPGQAACEKIREKYLSEPWAARGFQIEIQPPVEGKDYNELLISEKRSMCI